MEGAQLLYYRQREARPLELTMALTLTSVLTALVWTIATAELSWWQTSIFYQVYPRSYQDSDGDGIGDIRGIMSRLDYLKELGVTGIWMNPIYDSPLKDFGYDTSNYTNIDKTFGTFDDFSALVDKLHSLGMHILVDIIPNHSSDEHIWFKQSVKRIDPYTDYYVWLSGTNNSKILPNKWLSVMGGSAWEWHEKRKQYYYHAFLKEQPDFNYRNPKVVEEMKNILKFWLDLGVDGFRIDAVPFLVEDKYLRDEPRKPQCTEVNPSDCFIHMHTQNQKEAYDVLAQLHELVEGYKNDKYPGQKIMVTEAYADLHTLRNYFEYEGKKTSTMSFNFELMKVRRDTNGTNIKNSVDKWTSNLIDGGWSNWVTGNHDQSRVGRKVGLPLTDGMNMILLLLPGTTFSYYGEELGMDDTYVYCFQMQDVQAIRQAGVDCKKMQILSRDPERTPMQWDTSPNAGFSTHRPWLPINPDYSLTNVKAQRKDPRSHLNIYKKLTSLKKEMAECKNMTTLAPASGWVFAFLRYNCKSEADKYIVVVNFFNQNSVVNLSKDFKLDKMYVRAASKCSNKKTGSKISVTNFTLGPKEGLVLAKTPSPAA